MLLYALLALAVWYALLRQRLAPRPLMQAWFFVINTLMVFPFSALTATIRPMCWLGVPHHIAQQLCIYPLCVAFRVVYWANPQIRMAVKFEANVDGHPRSWHDLPTARCAVVGNHTSFWDVYAFLCTVPLARLTRFRTLLKASLTRVPIAGQMLLRTGHFPVYFVSDEDGNFQVDKERQAEVQKGVDRHIREGGCIAIFPEGAVNRNPRTLLPFRFGTFQTIFDHRLPTYYVVAVGNEQAWPRGSMWGGLPADIYARVGAFAVDFETGDPVATARAMQAHMQSVYDSILADMEAMQRGEKVAGYQSQ